ncbi:hypothetical protein PoB_004053700 [Plakobranchus ocellatus]|uniref:Uncharacterized protein n=1 Tax=Plakobranchus ocellatus TaxID=259542 RepID=A0AAV4B3E7_9GAST|nr:hypothetical protein PoB_004053700 [Plakobranchus ocellatus]
MPEVLRGLLSTLKTEWEAHTYKQTGSTNNSSETAQFTKKLVSTPEMYGDRWYMRQCGQPTFWGTTLDNNNNNNNNSRTMALFSQNPNCSRHGPNLVKLANKPISKASSNRLQPFQPATLCVLSILITRSSHNQLTLPASPLGTTFTSGDHLSSANFSSQDRQTSSLDIPARRNLSQPVELSRSPAEIFRSLFHSGRFP